MTEPKARVHFDALYNLVLGFLDDGSYRPGDRIGVKDLADRLNVSPTPMREILSRLVGRDLVEERRSEGYYVRVLDAPRIVDLYTLHGLVVDQALRGKNVGYVEVPPEDRMDVWRAFDGLVEATGNLALTETRRYLDARLALLRRCETLLFADLDVEAGQILAAIRQPDLAAARRAIRLFHQRRSRHARQLAFCVARHAGPRI